MLTLKICDIPTNQLEKNRDKLQQQIYDTNMYDPRFHSYAEYKQYQDKHEDLLERFCSELRSRNVGIDG